MQPKTHFAASFGEPPIGISQELRSQSTHPIPAKPEANPREAIFDTIAAAVVIGCTGSFVTFLFAWVTEFVPRLVYNILLSAFVGLCTGTIAYALMRRID